METTTMPAKKEISRADILAIETYVGERKERKAALLEHKRARRIALGPFATCHFESYQTMWHQVHEMLYIEKGGEEQIEDELAAYNPLIPNGRELVCTVMFEIDDPVRRKALLSTMGGVEETMFLSFDGEEIVGKPEEDVDRTTADGKASSVQFIHFAFTDAQVAKFRQSGAQITLGLRHPAYTHMTVLTDANRAALAEDFD